MTDKPDKKDKDDVIVLDEKKKREDEFDLGKEDIDNAMDDDDYDMEEDFDFDDGGD